MQGNLWNVLLVSLLFKRWLIMLMMLEFLRILRARYSLTIYLKKYLRLQGKSTKGSKEEGGTSSVPVRDALDVAKAEAELVNRREPITIDLCKVMEQSGLLSEGGSGSTEQVHASLLWFSTFLGFQDF